jgi:GNAT superfamily N-acetyltransferase
MNTDNSAVNIAISNMNKSEVQTAIQWAQTEGWNPGVHDAECFYNTDPNGFYKATLNRQLVGAVSIVKYSSNFAFAGFYIVKPDYRGKGVGLTLLNFVLDTCKNLNLGIDGVVSMQQRYKQAGFKTAYNNTRYAGVINGKFSNKCVVIQKADLSKIAAFDSRFFPVTRKKFLECWLYQKDGSALMMQDDVNGEIKGYGVIRKCFQGYKIGPLFAENKETAELLLSSLAVTASGAEVFLDVPEPNLAGVTLTKELGMVPVFSTVRMYTKAAPELPLNKIFGVTSFELG